MATQLIDREGNVVDAHGRAIRRRYSAVAQTKTLVSYLVRNAGFVAIATAGETCTITVAPGRTSGVAYLHASQLVPADARRVALSWFDFSWHYEIFNDRRPALARLVELMSTVTRCINDRYYAKARQPDALPRDHPLRGPMDIWRQTGGRFTLDDYPDLFQRQLNAKYVVIACDFDNASLVFDRIGEGLSFYRAGWASVLRGQPIEHQPDAAYGECVANAWRQAFLSPVPTLTDVDAVVIDPDLAAPYIARYTRLAMPTTTHSGDPRLLCASFADASINLRVEFHDEAEDIVN